MSEHEQMIQVSTGLKTLARQAQFVSDLRITLLRTRIVELAGIYGSIRAVGRALHIDHAYLHRLASGEKTRPSAVVLRKLGLDFPP